MCGEEGMSIVMRGHRWRVGVGCIETLGADAHCFFDTPDSTHGDSVMKQTSRLWLVCHSCGC